MATKNNANAFDPTNFTYTLYQDTKCPPSLQYIRGGFTDYAGYNRTTGGGTYHVTGVPGFSNADYMEYLEGYFTFQLAEVKRDTDAIREAKKVLDENPTFARMLELHKKGLL